MCPIENQSVSGIRDISIEERAIAEQMLFPESDYLNEDYLEENRQTTIAVLGAGHGGASGRYDHLREDAQMYAFLIEAVKEEA